MLLSSSSRSLHCCRTWDFKTLNWDFKTSNAPSSHAQYWGWRALTTTLRKQEVNVWSSTLHTIESGNLKSAPIQQNTLLLQNNPPSFGPDTSGMMQSATLFFQHHCSQGYHASCVWHVYRHQVVWEILPELCTSWFSNAYDCVSGVSTLVFEGICKGTLTEHLSLLQVSLFLVCKRGRE